MRLFHIALVVCLSWWHKCFRINKINHMSCDNTSPNRGEHDISMQRGNTFGGKAFTFTDTLTGDPIPILAAYCRIMMGSRVIHEFSPVVSGANNNIVTLSPISREDSNKFPLGVFTYDVETDLASGATETYIGGKFTVYKDSTRRP